MPVWKTFTWDQWDKFTWDDWKLLGMSGPTLVLENDFQVWDFRGTRVVYAYKRGSEVLMDESPDFLVMPASNAEREPSEGGYILRRRMMFAPLNVEIIPLPGDTFRLLSEYDENYANLMSLNGLDVVYELKNGGLIFYEKWWVESVTKTHAMYACRCVRSELNPIICTDIVIKIPQVINDKGTVVRVDKEIRHLCGRVQPINYEEVDEQHRKLFKRFYKIWVNTDIEWPHRSLAINNIYLGVPELNANFQLLDVRSRNTMQDMTELLVAANV